MMGAPPPGDTPSFVRPGAVTSDFSPWLIQMLMMIRSFFFFFSGATEAGTKDIALPHLGNLAGMK